MSANVETDARRALAIVRDEIAVATGAKKCHACGCFHQTVAALEATEAAKSGLAETLSAARAVFRPKKYDCLGCEVCYPAVAANNFSSAFPAAGAHLELCPSEPPEARPGWPPLPGDYTVLDVDGTVALCTLTDAELAREVVRARPPGVAIVGTLMTENLGIERIVENIVTNPAIRFLVLAGEDVRQKVGHLAGESLLALARGGVDAEGRIVGAPGKRPFLKNISRAALAHFARSVEVVDRIGEADLSALAELARALAWRSPGPADRFAPEGAPTQLEGHMPARLIQDPAGYFVIHLDRRDRRLLLEHYSNDGRLTAVIRGSQPAELTTVAIERGLLSRLDHAAYLGRELARAETALASGEPFVQDAAPERAEPVGGSCGCSGGTCS
jgi:tetrahydromethanopterin S-methyltransferase subunit A